MIYMLIITDKLINRLIKFNLSSQFVKISKIMYTHLLGQNMQKRTRKPEKDLPYTRKPIGITFRTQRRGRLI